MMLLCLHLVASADVIDMQDACPEGTYAFLGHGHSWCAPATCSPDRVPACNEGEVCAELGLCVTRTEVACPRDRDGRRPIPEDAAPEPPCTMVREEAHGPCTSDADCTTGACEQAPRCVRNSWSRMLCSILPAPVSVGLCLLVLAATRKTPPTRVSA